MQRARQIAFLLTLLVMAVAVASGASLAAGKGIEGTTAQELKDQRFRPPSVVKVAILPFHDTKGMERHARVAASAIALTVMRCGFQFAPVLETRDAQGLAAALCAAQEAVAARPGILAESALTVEDAVRVGRSLGADWVVFGEVSDLHSFTSRTVPALVNKGTATIQLQIADVSSGELILDRQCQEMVAAGPGVIGSRKGTAFERDAAQHCLQRLYADLCAALPRHDHDPPKQYTDAAVLSVQEAWDALLPEGIPATSAHVMLDHTSVPPALESGENKAAHQSTGDGLLSCVTSGDLGADIFVANEGLPGSLVAIITNRRGNPVSVDVSPGTVFTPRKDSYGRVVARRVTAAKETRGPRVPTGKIELNGHQTKAFYLEVYSLDMRKDFAPTDARLEMGYANKAARAVLATASEKELTHRAIQAAIWMQAGGASREEVIAQLSLSPDDIESLHELESSSGSPDIQQTEGALAAPSAVSHSEAGLADLPTTSGSSASTSGSVAESPGDAAPLPGATSALPSYEGPPWPKIRGPYDNGRSPFRGPSEPTVKWKVQLPSHGYGPLLVGRNGLVYASRYDGKRWSIHTYTPAGGVKWELAIDGDSKGSWSCPTLGPDGTLYVHCGTFLHAVTPDGEVKWKAKCGRLESRSGGLKAPAVGADGSVYLPLADRQLCAIAPDGQHKWTVTLQGRLPFTPAVAPDGTIYVASDAKNLYLVNAVSPDGVLKWAARVDDPGLDIIVVAGDGTTYAGPDQTRRLYAITPDGQVKWKYGPAAAPSIGHDGKLYMTYRRDVTVLDSAGARVASFIPSEVRPRGCASDYWLCAPTIDSDGTLYVCSIPNYYADPGSSPYARGNLAAVNTDGTLKWVLRDLIGYGFRGQPAIGRDGTVYICSDRWLYAVGKVGNGGHGK